MEKHTNEVEDNQMRALSWKTRVSYGLGDTACNVVYGMIGSLLTIFYTDYVGISAAAIGVIMLISRIFDGCSDVIMGFVVNKTHSKYGQSRPWILWMAIPYAVSAVLLFTVPHTATNIQLIYIFVTYNFTATVCYTAFVWHFLQSEESWQLHLQHHWLNYLGMIRQRGLRQWRSGRY